MLHKNENLIKLGKRIRECRKAKGYSQEAIAAEAQLDRSYMGKVERGTQNISILNLMRIAIALKVEVGTLIPPVKQLKIN